MLSPEERTRFEEMTGPIQRVEIVARDVELIWTGRRLGPSLTERTILHGPKGAIVRECRLQMQIEACQDGWRVVRSALLPPLRRTDCPSGETRLN